MIFILGRRVYGPDTCTFFLYLRPGGVLHVCDSGSMLEHYNVNDFLTLDYIWWWNYVVIKQMIGGEVPKLMGKACELFIQELTYRALMQDDDTNKHIVKPSDVAKAILQTDLFDFLTDVLVDYCVSDEKVRRVLFFFFIFFHL